MFRRALSSRYVFAAIPLTAFGLGTWQVYRLQWKTKLIEDLRSLTELDPVDPPANLSDLLGPDYQWRRIKLHGEFDHAREVRVGPRTREGVAGMHVVTPFTLDNGQRLLVNRGFVPTSSADPRKRPEGQVEGKLTIYGLPRKSERPNRWVPDNEPDRGLWFWVDAPILASLNKTEPVVVDALADPPNPGGLPIGGQTAVNIRNNHLEYVVTWYLLAAATTVMTVMRWK